MNDPFLTEKQSVPFNATLAVFSVLFQRGGCVKLLRFAYLVGKSGGKVNNFFDYVKKQFTYNNFLSSSISGSAFLSRSGISEAVL